MTDRRVSVRWRRPACDIYKSDASLEIFADVPGARRQDIGISASGDDLVIESRLPEDLAEADRPCYRRKFRLSAHVEHNAIRARLEAGVLHLTIPLAEPADAHTIEIEE